MGLEKAIISGKEKRKMYRGAKSVSCSCRNHGGSRKGRKKACSQCEWCLSNRKHSSKVREEKFK